MKTSIKDYFIDTVLAIVGTVVIIAVGGSFLYAWEHMTPQERDDILIIFFMSQQQ